MPVSWLPPWPELQEGALALAPGTHGSPGCWASPRAVRCMAGPRSGEAHTPGAAPPPHGSPGCSWTMLPTRSRLHPLWENKWHEFFWPRDPLLPAAEGCHDAPCSPSPPLADTGAGTSPPLLLQSHGSCAHPAVLTLDPMQPPPCEGWHPLCPARTHQGRPRQSTAGPASPRRGSGATRGQPGGCRRGDGLAAPSRRTGCSCSTVPRHSRARSPARLRAASQRSRSHPCSPPARCTPVGEAGEPMVQRSKIRALPGAKDTALGTVEVMGTLGHR